VSKENAARNRPVDLGRTRQDFDENQRLG